MAVQGIKMTVPAGEPAVAGAPPVPVAAGDVSGGGDVTAPPPPEEEREEEEEYAVLGYDDLTAGEDYYSDEEEDDGDEDVDSDDSEFEDDDRPPPGVGIGEEAARSRVLLAGVRFLGRPARFASVQSTASFMRLTAEEAAPPGNDGGGGGGGEILVRYCYTRFLAPQSGGDGVEMHAMGPKLARVRFHLPSHAAAAAADPATSLRLAGASLASLGLYPSRFGAHLRELWSGQVTAAPVRVPSRTARLLVTVDVGILRPGDRTPARMRSMRAALESVARDGDGGDEGPSSAFDAGMELRLPAPLASEDDARPAKRRRVTGEDCPICCEALERGLAAWPECSHIFHGSCLEEHLLRGYQECPMCRSALKLNCPSTTIV